MGMLLSPSLFKDKRILWKFLQAKSKLKDVKSIRFERFKSASTPTLTMSPILLSLMSVGAAQTAATRAKNKTKIFMMLAEGCEETVQLKVITKNLLPLYTNFSLSTN